MRWEKRLRWRFGFLRVAMAQVRTGIPPEAGATFDRLRSVGVPAWRAYWLLAAAYEAEVASMILEERVYDHEIFLRHLDRLPETPTVSLKRWRGVGRHNVELQQIGELWTWSTL